MVFLLGWTVPLRCLYACIGIKCRWLWSNTEGQSGLILVSHSAALFLLIHHFSRQIHAAPAQITKHSSYIPPPLSLSLVQLSISARPLSFQYKRTKKLYILSINLSRPRCIIVAVQNVQKIRKSRRDVCRRAPVGQERLNLQVQSEFYWIYKQILQLLQLLCPWETVYHFKWCNRFKLLITFSYF